MRLSAIFLTAFFYAASAGPYQVPPERLRAGIEKLLREGIPAHDIGARPKHPILSDLPALDAFCAAVSTAAESKKVPAFLLVAIAFREGSFMPDSVGGLGERTTFQLTPATVNYVANIEPRCNDHDALGSAFCAATWLSILQGRCGSWGGAMSIYATGRSCLPATPKVTWIVKDRLGLAKWLEKHTRTLGK